MILLVHEDDPRHSRFDFAREKSEAAADLQRVLDDNESLVRLLPFWLWTSPSL